MQNSLPAGGLRLYREGVEPSGSLRKISGYITILLSRTCPVARFVYAKPPFRGPEAVLGYLARYTHRVAISNSRLIALDERGVTFRYKDYRRDGRARFRTMTLAPDEFIRRFLLPRPAQRVSPHPPLWATRQRRMQSQYCARQRTDRQARASDGSAGSARRPRPGSQRHGRPSPAMPGPRSHNACHSLIALRACRGTLLPPLYRCRLRRQSFQDRPIYRRRGNKLPTVIVGSPPPAVASASSTHATAASNPHRRQTARPPSPPRVLSWEAFGRRPSVRQICHDGPASETLHQRGHSLPAIRRTAPAPIRSSPEAILKGSGGENRTVALVRPQALGCQLCINQGLLKNSLARALPVIYYNPARSVRQLFIEC